MHVHILIGATGLANAINTLCTKIPKKLIIVLYCKMDHTSNSSQLSPISHFSDATSITEAASIQRVFHNHREYPELPEGYDWERQKKAYCPRHCLRMRDLASVREKRTYPHHTFGYVFCHRGLYERSQRIIDNSMAAIENGTKQGLFLHEVDAFVWERLDKGFVAHDKGSRRVTNKEGLWTSYTLQDILDSQLVTRRVKTEGENVDFASSYLATDEKVAGLLSTVWNQAFGPEGTTLQIDLRDEDFPKALAYYIFHISKPNLPRIDPETPKGSLVASLFKSTILKGTTMGFPYYEDLKAQIRSCSTDLYGTVPMFYQENHLKFCPHMIIVFYPKTLKALVEGKTSRSSKSSRPSFGDIYNTFMEQVLSFVEVGDGEHFILEIVHSGLGLGYNKETGEARNPLNGVPLKNSEVIYESCIDRAMIDVSLELRKQYPRLLFSSCTRLPDVITPEGKFKASHETSKLVELEEGEAGLSTKLRAMHGGLYPQSHLVVADDPAAEIAARTWIDQSSGLDRSDLLKYTYNEWLEGADERVVAAIKQLNDTEFLPNLFGFPTSVDSRSSATVKSERQAESIRRVISWFDNLPSTLMSPDERSQEAGSGNGKQRSANDQKRISLGDSFDVPNGYFFEDFKECAFSVAGCAFLFQSKAGLKNAKAIAAAHTAASAGNVEVLADLLSSGISVSSTGGFLHSLLESACRHGHIEAVKFLLDSGADIHRSGPFGTVLEVASVVGNINIVSTLFEATEGKNPYAKHFAKSMISAALQKAACHGNDDVVKLLLEKGADVNYAPEFNMHKVSDLKTPLENAIIGKSSTIVKLLLDKGADVNKFSSYPPLYLAVMQEPSTSIVKLLLKAGAKINVGNSHDEDTLYLACKHGNITTVNLLLEKRAVIDFPFGDGFKPEIVSLLVKYGGVPSLMKESSFRDGSCPPDYFSSGPRQRDLPRRGPIRTADIRRESKKKWARYYDRPQRSIVFNRGACRDCFICYLNKRIYSQIGENPIATLISSPWTPSRVSQNPGRITAPIQSPLRSKKTNSLVLGKHLLPISLLQM